MTLQIFTIIDIIAVLVAYLVSRTQYRYVDVGGMIIMGFLLFSMLTEVSAEIVYLLTNNKAPVFHFSAVINLLIVTMYFIKMLKLKAEAQYIIAALILLPLLSVVNSIYLQPLNKPNTNILMLRSLSIIIMSLVALYKMFVDESIKKVTRYPHFYFWSLLLLMHAGTFFFWGLLLTISSQDRQYLPLVQYTQGSINALVYLGIGGAFLLYRKRKTYEWH